jgi:hypothetical protein
MMRTAEPRGLTIDCSQSGLLSPPAAAVASFGAKWMGWEKVAAFRLAGWRHEQFSGIHAARTGSDDDGGAEECPFCSSTDVCDHVLLVVNRTFRAAEGGVVMEVINDRWSRLAYRRSGRSASRSTPTCVVAQSFLRVVDVLRTAAG